MKLLVSAWLQSLQEFTSKVTGKQLVKGVWISIVTVATQFVPAVNELLTFKHTTSEMVGGQQAILNPVFSEPSAKKSLHILIPRFETFNTTNDEDCIGRLIDHRIKQIVYRTKLPIHSEYVHEIPSPNDPAKARELVNNNNADLLLYGLFHSSNSTCDNGAICFRTTASNFLRTVSDSSQATIEHFDLNPVAVKQGEIEGGFFTLDTLSFDRWIQSLLILKRKENYYKQYTGLDKVRSNLPIKDRINGFNIRGRINMAIGNDVDAVTDFDSVLVLTNHEIDNDLKIIRSESVPIKDFAKKLQKVAKNNDFACNVFINKILCLFNINKNPTILLNNEIYRIDKHKSDPGNAINMTLQLVKDKDIATTELGIYMDSVKMQAPNVRDVNKLKRIVKDDPMSLYITPGVEIHSFPWQYRDLFVLMKSSCLLHFTNNSQESLKELQTIKTLAPNVLNIYYMQLALLYFKLDRESALRLLIDDVNKNSYLSEKEKITMKKILITLQFNRLSRPVIALFSIVLMLVWLDTLLFSVPLFRATFMVDDQSSQHSQGVAPKL